MSRLAKNEIEVIKAILKHCEKRAEIARLRDEAQKTPETLSEFLFADGYVDCIKSNLKKWNVEL